MQLDNFSKKKIRTFEFLECLVKCRFKNRVNNFSSKALLAFEALTTLLGETTFCYAPSSKPKINLASSLNLLEISNSLFPRFHFLPIKNNYPQGNFSWKKKMHPLHFQEL